MKCIVHSPEGLSVIHKKMFKPHGALYKIVKNNIYLSFFKKFLWQNLMLKPTILCKKKLLKKPYVYSVTRWIKKETNNIIRKLPNLFLLFSVRDFGKVKVRCFLLCEREQKKDDSEPKTRWNSDLKRLQKTPNYKLCKKRTA